MDLADESFRFQLERILRRSGLAVEDLDRLTVLETLRIKGIGRKAMQRIYGNGWSAILEKRARPFVWLTSYTHNPPRCESCGGEPTVRVMRRSNSGQPQYVGLFCRMCGEHTVDEIREKERSIRDLSQTISGGGGDGQKVE